MASYSSFTMSETITKSSSELGTSLSPEKVMYRGIWDTLKKDYKIGFNEIVLSKTRYLSSSCPRALIPRASMHSTVSASSLNVLRHSFAKWRAISRSLVNFRLQSFSDPKPLKRLVSVVTSNQEIYPVNKIPKILLATDRTKKVKYDPEVTRCNGPSIMSSQTLSLVGPTYIVLSLKKVFVVGLYV